MGANCKHVTQERAHHRRIEVLQRLQLLLSRRQCRSARHRRVGCGDCGNCDWRPSRRSAAGRSRRRREAGQATVNPLQGLSAAGVNRERRDPVILIWGKEDAEPVMVNASPLCWRGAGRWQSPPLHQARARCTREGGTRGPPPPRISLGRGEEQLRRTALPSRPDGSDTRPTSGSCFSAPPEHGLQ